MTYKFILKIVLASLGSLAALAPIANAQERPKCYIIDDSGQLTDLTDICDVSQKRSSQTASTTSDGANTVNNNTNLINLNPSGIELSSDDRPYILRNDSLLNGSGIFNSSYYIDNEIGSDYTAYRRTYKTFPTSIVRQTLKEQIFQFDPHNRSFTSILRRGQSDIPFIIYRYPI